LPLLAYSLHITKKDRFMILEPEPDKCAMGEKVFVRGRRRSSEGRHWAS
jgi:hypothetical protein